MSDLSESGILYTQYLTAAPVASLWSYETRSRAGDRRSIKVNADGSREYWLDRWDPLQSELLARARTSHIETVGRTAARLIRQRAGRILVDDMARTHGLSRQQFARQFTAAAGLPPKLFARITRFQSLVHALLSTDVAQWASMSTAVGFYDQSHMINEFRTFAGSPPTMFFQPHGGDIDPEKIHISGRPSEWLRLTL